jgi:organic hydroperoxide reductase OsmC/OhrA
MKMSARIDNSAGKHQIELTTNGNTHSIQIPSRATGFGSSASGGELLFLALATCYCNDIYREAAKRNITVERIEVEVNGNFGAVGEPAQNVSYHAQVHAKGTEAEIRALMEYTDTVAEIQNTLRVETPVKLTQIEVVNT